MPCFAFRNGKLELGNRTYIMGIVNVTPDSFSDGGKFFSVPAAIEHALSLVEDGADIIDLGACSTKPFSVPVTSDTERERLLPVIAGIKKCSDVPLSIDTFYPSTAEAVLSAGADIINDVGGIFDPDTCAVVKKYGAGYIVMHGGVKLAPAQTEFEYKNGIITDVNAFFAEISEKLTHFGIRKECICFDPGFGFMKNTGQNLELLKNLRKLEKNENALLVGLSRKRFIGELSGDDDPTDRLAGTLAANVLAAVNGADIIRTHDVKLHRQAICLADEYRR